MPPWQAAVCKVMAMNRTGFVLLVTFMNAVHAWSDGQVKA